MRPPRVTVVGAGVVGLSVAHELARRGDAVTVLCDPGAPRGVSSVAAAVWFPYRSGRSAAADEWLARSLSRFTALAADEATGVDLQRGTVVERHARPDRSWTAAVPHTREAAPDELPPGAVSGVRATVPVITISQYLPWLVAACERAGVRLLARTVTSVDELAGAADLVVVAAGMRAGALLGDHEVHPVRGQVVRLDNPGLTDWVIDEDDPAGLTYVVPRRDAVVCGGTAEVGSWDTSVDPDTERAILQRTAALVPALAGLPVQGREAGLRPARSTVRLAPVPGHAVPVIACYGHGGAGVTLSWGCAETVAALAGQVLDRPRG